MALTEFLCRSMLPSKVTRDTLVLPCECPPDIRRHGAFRATKKLTKLARGMAPVAHVLFNKFMKFNPKNPKWANRDRFVLS